MLPAPCQEAQYAQASQEHAIGFRFRNRSQVQVEDAAIAAALGIAHHGQDQRSIEQDARWCEYLTLGIAKDGGAAKAGQSNAVQVGAGELDGGTVRTRDGQVGQEGLRGGTEGRVRCEREGIGEVAERAGHGAEAAGPQIAGGVNEVDGVGGSAGATDGSSAQYCHCDE